MNLNSRNISWLIGIASALIFLPYLGAVHLFDWDEINFAEAAREMIMTGNYSSVQIDYMPFWEKPPLFLWLQAISMNIFGVNEWAARFPNALCGIVTLVTLFHIGRRWINEKFGIAWALLYGASLLPHFYFKSGIIDPWFNLFIFLGIYFLIQAYNNRPAKQMALSGLFIGLAIMTKGPVALLIYGAVYGVYLVINGFKRLLHWRHLTIFTLSMIAVGASWFIVEIFRGRQDIIIDFIVYQIRLLRTQDAGHGGPFYYHFIVLLLGCFPASIFFIQAYRKETDTPGIHWMKILFWVVLILFSLVRTKIIHYSSLCYFPLTAIAAYGLYQWQSSGEQLSKWAKAGIALIGTVLAILFTALPLVERFKSDIIASGIIKDQFALANLQAEVHWGGWEWLLGIFFFLGLITSLLLWERLQEKALYLLLLFCVMGLELMSLVYIPKVEQYSQGAAIEFYQSKQDEDCYITTLGFKSYAHLFYSHKRPQNNPKHSDRDWLLSGEADKPVYAVTKNIRKKDWLTPEYNWKVLYEKNGFVFLQLNSQ